MPYTVTGITQPPVSSQVVVLYDARSGDVVHMHEALFFSNHRSRQERETMLTALVRQAAREINPNLDLDAYDMLHVSDLRLGQAEYKVDVARKQLVEIATS